MNTDASTVTSIPNPRAVAEVTGPMEADFMPATASVPATATRFRTVDELVEVIVNNCVVARGEVVVVEGNYGVRIHQIMTRQERLETLP